MPLIPGVVETYDKLKSLHKSKNDDYSGTNGAFFNFEVAEYFGSMFKGARDKVYAIVLGIKFARLSVVLYKEANHEAVEDTFDDFINYAAIWKADVTARNNKKVLHELVERNTIRETKV